MTVKQFFNSRACTVDMNSMRNNAITENDSIVCVDYIKPMHAYMVYYCSHIYHDDREYNCRQRFHVLPDIVERWCENKNRTENAYKIRWC